MNKVSFYLFPYLLADLPLFPVWDCDPTQEREILPLLQPYASRLIFDSETVDQLQSFSQRTIAFAHARHLDIVDLNWTRFGGWREVINKIFDTPERVEQLSFAKQIDITYNAMENTFFHHNQTQAIFLQAWLGACLGWKFKSLANHQTESTAHYRKAHAEVVVTLRPAKIEDRAPGSIFSLDILGKDHHHYSVKRLPGTQQVKVEISSDETCDLPFTLNLRGTQLSYALLKEVLFQHGREHYLHMLHMLNQQDWNRA